MTWQIWLCGAVVSFLLQLCWNVKYHYEVITDRREETPDELGVVNIVLTVISILWPVGVPVCLAILAILGIIRGGHKFTVYVATCLYVRSQKAVVQKDMQAPDNYRG